MTNSIFGPKPDSKPGGPTTPEWDDLLARYALAPRELAKGRELQRRLDSKFVLPVSAAGKLLGSLADDYALLAAGPTRVASYRSLYFDTADLDLFHAHRRGRRVRQKVRIRHYSDRRVSVLEVKKRTSELLTTKVRRERPYGDNELGPDDVLFVQAHTGLRQDLLPQVWVEFRRMTLLAIHIPERVTVDFDIRITMGPRVEVLPNLAIVEVKQSPFHRRTPAMLALRADGWRPGWASKYCTAIALMHPDVRVNRLLRGLRVLARRAA